ncbi:unnamed protein product, partial [Prorocentrum cordatum]
MRAQTWPEAAATLAVARVVQGRLPREIVTWMLTVTYSRARDMFDVKGADGSLPSSCRLSLESRIGNAMIEVIQEAIREEVPDLLRWAEWGQAEPAEVFLPNGGSVEVDRGAEQGDPFGSTRCGATLRRRVSEARVALAGAVQVWDCWFAGDGQVFCRRAAADRVFAVLGAAAARCGIARATGVDAKTTVKLMCRPSFVAELCDAWAALNTANACKILPPSAGAEMLGPPIGDADFVGAFVREMTHEVGQLHAALRELERPAAELVLGRCCADVAKISHFLRTVGDVVPDEVTAAFDLQQRAFVEEALSGHVSEEKSAQALARLAFVASRRFVEDLRRLDGLRDLVNRAMARYDRQTQEAQRAVEAGLLDEHVREVRELCRGADAAALASFAQVSGGQASHNGGAAVPEGAAAGTVDEDCAALRGGPHQLQRRMAVVCDCQRLGDLCGRFAAQGKWENLRRLKELGGPAANADWMWRPTEKHGPVVQAEMYAIALQARLGAIIVEKATVCRGCGAAILDQQACRASCCTRAEATRGHKEMRDAVFVLAQSADASAETEVEGHCPDAPTLRPADIYALSSQTGLRSTIDIGVAPPRSQYAGEDCCEAMGQRKLDSCGAHLQALQDSGILCIPAVCSTFGRKHPATTRVLETLARRAARTHGLRDYKCLVRAARANIGAALARRQ